MVEVAVMMEVDLKLRVAWDGEWTTPRVVGKMSARCRLVEADLADGDEIQNDNGDIR